MGETKSKESFVYLAPHSREPRFKLGKADVPRERLSQLSRANAGCSLDWDKGLLLGVSSAEDAFRLERALRYIPWVHNALIEKDKIADAYDGRTEWHGIEIFQRLSDYLIANSAALGCTITIGISRPTDGGATAAMSAATATQFSKSRQRELSFIRGFLKRHGSENKASRYLAVSSVQRLMPFCVWREAPNSLLFLSERPLPEELPRWPDFRKTAFDQPLIDRHRYKHELLGIILQLSANGTSRFFTQIYFEFRLLDFDKRSKSKCNARRSRDLPEYGDWLKTEAAELNSFQSTLASLVPLHPEAGDAVHKEYLDLHNRHARAAYLGMREATGWEPEAGQAIPDGWQIEYLEEAERKSPYSSYL